MERNADHRGVSTEPATRERGPALYLFLLAVETLGTAIIFVEGVPIYREWFRAGGAHRPEPGILLWGWAALTLVQAAYWTRVRINPPMPRRRSMVVGHLALFASRLSFLLVASYLTFAFLNHFGAIDVPPLRLLMLVALSFSVFCWNLEMERLANALNR